MHGRSNDRSLVMLIILVERVSCWARVSGSWIWVVLGASVEVRGVGGHQAAYVTCCSVRQHLFGVVGSAFGALSMPSNYGPPVGSVDCVNNFFYSLSDGMLLFFEVVQFLASSFYRSRSSGFFAGRSEQEHRARARS